MESLWVVDRDVSTAILLVFIRRWGQLYSAFQFLCTAFFQAGSGKFEYPEYRLDRVLPWYHPGFSLWFNSSSFNNIQQGTLIIFQKQDHFQSLITLTKRWKEAILFTLARPWRPGNSCTETTQGIRKVRYSFLGKLGMFEKAKLLHNCFLVILTVNYFVIGNEEEFLCKVCRAL